MSAAPTPTDQPAALPQPAASEPKPAALEAKAEAKAETGAVAPAPLDADKVQVLDTSLSPLEGWTALSRALLLFSPREAKEFGPAPPSLVLAPEATRTLPNGNKLYRLVVGGKHALQCLNVVSATTGRRYAVVRRETERSLGLPEALPPVYGDLNGTLPPEPAKGWNFLPW